MVYSFSGTGNSAYAAKKIAEATGDVLTDLNAQIRKINNAGDVLPADNSYPVPCDSSDPSAGPLQSAGPSQSADYSQPTDDTQSAAPMDRLVFCVPTYAWRIPNVVRDWIRAQNFPAGTKIWFVMTCGGEIGDAAATNKALCDEKGLTYMGTASVLMPENYIAMFSAPEREEALKIVEKAAPVIKAAAACIKEDSPFPKPRKNLYDRAMSQYVNPLFYRFFIGDKAFAAGDACTSCGVCVQSCPLCNIELADGKPRWKGNCTHCMACITLCPQKAIEYGKASKGKPRYRCPQ